MFHTLLQELQQKFEAHTNSANAEAMAKYMRGKYSYFGIKKPLRAELEKDFLKKAHNPDKSAPEKLIRTLWALPQREFQMTAIELIRKYEKYAPLEYLALYEDLITDKSWWDTVDMLAANAVGGLLKRHPTQIHPSTERWMSSGNMWLQRTALLFQLKYKQNTDFDLLCRLIQQLASSEEFFIRKAIGWSLREYSKREPKAVKEFLATQKLANLSIREASKYL